LPDRGTETILLVEDDQLVRDLAAGVLRSAGYNVRTAATPLEAIEMAADPAERLDLLLTDEVMPGMSGGDLAQRLRADRPGLRVLRVSGYSENLTASPGGAGPGSAFLPKPYTPLALRQHVRRLLDGTPA
jgi:CheY-like chemotaxis protein